MAPTPTMAMGGGGVVLSWLGHARSAPVEHVRDGVHVLDQAALGGQHAGEPRRPVEVGVEAPGPRRDPAEPFDRHLQRRLAGEHAAHGGERGGVEAAVALRAAAPAAAARGARRANAAAHSVHRHPLAQSQQHVLVAGEPGQRQASMISARAWCARAAIAAPTAGAVCCSASSVAACSW